MTNPNSDESKPDDLEITSIGSLYSGPWDKKYWSSSRGKDRYPYPIGYGAVRAHNGNTYMMEIQQGPKGPLFSIIDGDGQSCLGQTPDMAWGKFQKQCLPRAKIWHGKRFSCKIDGVEFFGFKNPFVQRLLRELAAGVHGAADQSSVPSSFCNGASGTDIDDRSKEACLDLGGSQIKGKRSRKRENGNAKSASRAGSKKTRNEELVTPSEASSSEKGSERQEDNGNLMLPFLDEEHDSHKHPAVLPSIVRLVSVPQEESEISLKDCNPLEANGSGNGKSIPTAINFSVDEKSHANKSPDTKMEDVDFPMAPDSNSLDAINPKDSESLTGVELFAPDTLDFTQDKNADSSLMRQDRSTLDAVTADGMLTEYHPEEDTPTTKSNASSQNMDFDSVGQEMAKSMMAFLLPQAIPLLNKSSRKKRSIVSHLEVLSCTVKSHNETNGANASYPGLMFSNKDAKEENMHTESIDVGLGAPTKSIVPDSLDDDRYADHLVATNEHNESIIDHLRTSSSKDVSVHEELGMTSTGRLQESGKCVLASLPLFASPIKKVFSEEIREETCIDDRPVGSYINSKKRNETADDHTTGNQRGMLNSYKVSEKETAPTVYTKTGNVSLSQEPKVVYTRRKLQTTSHIKGNKSAPASETTICKYTVPETCPSTETLRVGPCDDNSNKRDPVCSQDKIIGHSHLSAEETSMNSAASMRSALLPDQALLIGDKDPSHCLDLSGSHLDIQVDENVVNCDKLQKVNDSGTSHKHRSYDLSSILFTSDSKPQKMELNNGLAGNLVFMGCYTHPVPVLSVMLSTKGNDIYICVLCGLLVGKDINLFIYKVALEETRVGHPSLFGHTSVTLPDVTNFSGGMALERSCLQFSPDGQCLVLLDSIKTPFCRQGNTRCLCPTCASSCSEENTVKIVQVQLGYVSLVARLKTVESQRCILVCEPDNLVSVGKSGRLHLWVMSSTWSAQMDYIVFPAEDCISPGIVDLKKIPNCTHLIVGHNGFGEFSLWDISKRILVSRFSASSSICQFCPISLFPWKVKLPVSSDFNMEEHVNNMMASTSKDQFSFEGEDIAVCLLISSTDCDAPQDYESGNLHSNPVGRWRLALMVKNMVIFGAALDSRAAVIGASAGQGICGTFDGLVYMWELATGTKLGTMHHFKGGGVSCIAADDSRSGAVAVAGDNQVLVYLHSR